METKETPFKKMVFVCTNLRETEERPCCARRGGGALHAQLKEMVRARGLHGKVRVCRSGCLDRCPAGPNVMIFPDNRWYSGVTAEDLERILEDIAAGL